MARTRKKKEILDTVTQQSEIKKSGIEEMSLKSLSDYTAYNLEACKLNKRFGYCRYPLEQCPEELHPKDRIVFGRIDQPTNPLPVRLSNSHIDYNKVLNPGETYDLPRIVADYLMKKGTPYWKWFTKEDGSQETGIAKYNPRFILRTIYTD